MKLGQTEHAVYETKTGDRAAYKVIQDKCSKSWRNGEQEVVLPKSRPGSEHQEQADLEAEKDKCNGEETVHEMLGCRPILTVAAVYDRRFYSDSRSKRSF